MKVIIPLLLISSALLYYPLFPSEEFETPKSAAFITFGCFSFFAVRWRQILKDRIAQMILLFTASVAISSFFSIDPHMSVFGSPKLNNGLLVTISYLVLYLAASQGIRKYDDRRNLIRVLMATSFVVALYAIAQVMGYDFKTWYGTLTEHGYTRPMSSLGHPNFMAAYLAMTLPFVFWIFDTSDLKLERIAAVVVGLCSITAIFFSQSRGMWWSTVAAVIVYLVMTKASIKKVGRILLVGLSMFGIGAVASPEFRESLVHRYEVFNIGMARTEYLKGAIRIWKRYPFLGSGTDTFEPAFQHQRTPYYWIIERAGSPHRAHNEFLNILATQGLLGAVIAVLLAIAVFFSIKASTSAFVAPAAASIAAFFVQEISSFHVVATGTLFIMCLSFLRSDESA